MAHIFISYSKQDIMFGRYLRAQLNDAGFDVWMDEQRIAPSAHWWPTIERNIETCSAFVIIMSPAARESDWVEREVLYAEQLDKPIFPVLLSGAGWPRLGNIQYADMRGGMGATLPPLLIERLQAAGVTPPPRRFIPRRKPARVSAPGEARSGGCVGRLTALMLLLILLAGGFYYLAENTEIGDWINELFGNTGNDAPSVAIIQPHGGDEVPQNDIWVGAEVANITGPGVVRIVLDDGWFAEERPVDPGTKSIEVLVPSGDPGPHAIQALFFNEMGELLDDDVIEVFVRAP